MVNKFASFTSRKQGQSTGELGGTSGVPTGGGVGGFKPPPPEIPKAHQKRAKLNPIVKTVKNC